MLTYINWLYKYAGSATIDNNKKIKQLCEESSIDSFVRIS